MRRYFNIDHYTEFCSGSPVLCPSTYQIEDLLTKDVPNWSFKYRAFRFVLDLVCAVSALPLIALMAMVLWVVNPFLNPGPVFFRQFRVGQFGQPFRMWKFRTMMPSEIESRDPNVALEEERITILGGMLRRSRLDEIPNLINVLRGEMSVVGPRPDAASHVEYYSGKIHGYSERHRVKPGITGLAQVEQGYVEDETATKVKTKYDNLYVERSCGRMDLYILYRTIGVVTSGIGAK
ncbi:sugar transferase [Roseobacter sp.]|uniref:sugar transferase n=1 Tax=Roseobacter sp. TaxID=1907202 RepID=UPI00385DD46C